MIIITHVHERIYVYGAEAKNTSISRPAKWGIFLSVSGEHFPEKWPHWPSLVETYILHSTFSYVTKVMNK